MNDKDFHKIDEAWMEKTKSIREKPVSEGMLKGFSASVERKIAGTQEDGARRVPALRPAWVPALAVMVIASVVVLRSPIVPHSVEFAQVSSEEELQVQEEMEVLQDLGVWDEYESVTEEELLQDSNLELTSNGRVSSSLA